MNLIGKPIQSDGLSLTLDWLADDHDTDGFLLRFNLSCEMPFSVGL